MLSFKLSRLQKTGANRLPPIFNPGRNRTFQGKGTSKAYGELVPGLVSVNFSPKERNKLVIAPTPTHRCSWGERSPENRFLSLSNGLSVALLGTRSRRSAGTTHHLNLSGFVQHVDAAHPVLAWHIAERLTGQKIVQNQHRSLTGIERIFFLLWASLCQRCAFESNSPGGHCSPELGRAQEECGSPRRHPLAASCWHGRGGNQAALVRAQMLWQSCQGVLGSVKAARPHLDP